LNPDWCSKSSCAQIENINGNGHADLIVANPSTDTISVMLGAGKGIVGAEWEGLQPN
jgi:hypothetical protein